MKVRFLLPARQKFREAIFACTSEQSELGDECRDRVREASQRSMEFPTAWHPLSGAMRRCRTRRVPYALVNESFDKESVLIAVAHLHRAPVYWWGHQR